MIIALMMRYDIIAVNENYDNVFHNNVRLQYSNNLVHGLRVDFVTSNNITFIQLYLVGDISFLVFIHILSFQSNASLYTYCLDGRSSRLRLVSSSLVRDLSLIHI